MTAGIKEILYVPALDFNGVKALPISGTPTIQNGTLFKNKAGTVYYYAHCGGVNSTTLAATTADGELGTDSAKFVTSLDEATLASAYGVSVSRSILSSGGVYNFNSIACRGLGFRQIATLDITPFNEVKDYRERSFENMYNVKLAGATMQTSLSALLDAIGLVKQGQACVAMIGAGCYKVS